MTAAPIRRRGPTLAVLRTAAIRGAGAMAIVVLYVLIARLYPRSDSAFFFALLTASSIATPILLFGYNAGAVRALATVDGAGARREAFRGLRIGFARLTVASTAISAVVAAIVWSWSPEAVVLTVVIVGIIPAFSFLGHSLLGVRAYDASVVILNVANFVLIGAIACALRLAAPSWSDYRLQITISFAAASSLTLFVAALAWRRAVTKPPDDAPSSDSESPVSGGLVAFWIVSVLVATNNWLPQGLYYLSGAREDYASFSVAQRLANTVGFFIIVANVILAPRIARLFHRGELIELRFLYLRTARLTAALALPVAAVLIAAPSAVLSVFGDGYDGGARYLALLAGVQYVNVATGSSNLMLTMTGHARQLVIAMASAFVAGLVFLLVVRDTLDGFGYALTVAVTLVWQNLAAVWFVRRHLNISLLDAFRPRTISRDGQHRGSHPRDPEEASHVNS